jgi:propionyl-CoA carboxylase alpha chain
MDGENYSVTVRPIDGGYKVAFENRRFYITSKWLLGSKIFPCKINGKQYNLQIENVNGGTNITFMGSTVKAIVLTPRAAELTKFIPLKTVKVLEKNIVANMSGLIVDIKVNKGDKISVGMPIAIVEAMKMENILYSSSEGTITEIHFKKGDIVHSGEVIVQVD